MQSLAADGLRKCDPGIELKGRAPDGASEARPMCLSICVSLHCGAAFTFVPSFTGGSILICGPWTFGSTPAPGFSNSR